MKYLLSIGVLSALSTPPAFAGSVQDYVKNFIQQSQKFSEVVSLDRLARQEVVISFSHLDSWVHGQCTESATRQEILINASYWNELDEFQRELLVYHELGHCVLRLSHDESIATIAGESVPASIMHPHVMYMLSPEAFAKNSDGYFRRLFGALPTKPFAAFVAEGASSI